MYAVIETGGKQLRVEVGQSIFVEKLDVQPGEEVVFNTVVLYANRTTKIGTPYVKGAKVTCKVEKQGKEKKITVFKYKAKDGSSHRKQGHRQPYTMVKIESLGTGSKKAEPVKEAPKAEAKEDVKEAKPAKKVSASMKKDELIAFDKENDITIDEKATKAVIIEAIEAALK